MAYASPRFNRSAGQETDFTRRASPLANDLITALENEHVREVEILYRDQLMYRAELARVVSVMQQQMLPREKQLHDMLESIEASYANATKDLHAKMSGQVAGVQGKKLDKNHLIDPLEDMQNELKRIQQMLSRGTVTPIDITPQQRQQVEQQARQWSPPAARAMGTPRAAAGGFSPGAYSPAGQGYTPRRTQQMFLCQPQPDWSPTPSPVVNPYSPAVNPYSPAVLPPGAPLAFDNMPAFSSPGMTGMQLL